MESAICPNCHEAVRVDHDLPRLEGVQYDGFKGKDVQEGVDIFRKIKSFYIQMYEFLEKVAEGTRNNKYNRKELIDLSFILEKIGSKDELLDQLRKDVEARQKFLEKTAAYMICQDLINDENAETKFTGELATGSAEYSQVAAVPKSHEPVYQQFMKELGLGDVNPEIQKCLRVDWNAFNRYITALSEKGKALPASLKGVAADYKIKHTSLKGTPINEQPKKTARSPL